MVLRHQRQKVHRYNVLSFRHVDMQPSEYRYGVPFCEYNKNDKRRLLANINPYLWAKKKAQCLEKSQRTSPVLYPKSRSLRSLAQPRRLR
jgi:hypothetical protein